MLGSLPPQEREGAPPWGPKIEAFATISGAHAMSYPNDKLVASDNDPTGVP